MIVNKFFFKTIVFQKLVFKIQPYKKRSKIVLKNDCFLKRSLFEWVVFKNDRFFPKTKRLFLKTIEKRNKKQSFNESFQKRLTTLNQTMHPIPIVINTRVSYQPDPSYQ